MANTASPLERAFQLARSGKFGSVTDIRRQLKSEHVSGDQIHGTTLLRQLREVLKASQSTKAN
jgi:hypothetical protein